MIKLKPCPFCGGEAEFERAGTARMSTIVSCTECGATLESGEVGEMAGTSWNSRETDEQLAKANERVRELESDLLRQSVFMERTAEKLEQHREWQATANVLRRPTREAKQALNKFALEQNIEGAFKFASFLDSNNFSAAIAAKESGFFQLVETLAQQLRKEQEKC